MLILINNVAGTYNPLISGLWLNIFTWTFLVLGLISLITFVLYYQKAKEKTMLRTIIWAVVTAFLLALGTQFFLFQNGLTY